MKRLLSIFMSVIIFTIIGCTTQLVRDDDPMTLKSYAELSGMYVGTAINEIGFREVHAPYNKKYMAIIGTEFNLVVPEGSLKMANCWKGPARIDFTAFDLEAGFARDHGQKIRAHTLLWCRSVPEWLRKGYSNSEYSKEDISAMVERYIGEVMGYVEKNYPGLVISWDVVNEAIGPEQTISENGVYGWRPSTEDFWAETLGSDYVAKAFRWAHQSKPDAKLFYNDYRIEYSNSKADAAKRLIKGLVNDGVPIHGIGFQSHFSLKLSSMKYPWIDFSVASISSMIDYYAGLGLDVHITELDVGLNHDGSGATAKKLGIQADFYYEFTSMLLEKKAVTAICLWGFTDKLTWLDKPGVPEWPLLYDKNIEKKMAYIEFKRAFREKAGFISF